MIPEKGQHVKCFMRSTMVLEGIVEDWSDVQIVLKSLDNKNIMIVHRPTEDIALTKIILEESQEMPIEKSLPNKLHEVKSEIKDKLQEVIQSTGNVDLDKNNLNRLRKLVIEQDKQIIAQKSKEYFGTTNAPKQAIKYSNPFVKGGN